MKAQTGWSFPDNVPTSAFYIMTTPSAPLRRLRTFVLTGAATPPVPGGEHPVLAIHSHLLSVGTWLRAIFWTVIYSVIMAKTDFKSVEHQVRLCCERRLGLSFRHRYSVDERGGSHPRRTGAEEEHHGDAALRTIALPPESHGQRSMAEGRAAMAAVKTVSAACTSARSTGGLG